MGGGGAPPGFRGDFLTPGRCASCPPRLLPGLLFVQVPLVSPLLSDPLAPLPRQRPVGGISRVLAADPSDLDSGSHRPSHVSLCFGRLLSSFGELK